MLSQLNLGMISNHDDNRYLGMSARDFLDDVN